MKDFYVMCGSKRKKHEIKPKTVHWRYPEHRRSTRARSEGKGHGGAPGDKVEVQFPPLKSVTRVA